jgi:hypothetical protein
MKPLIILCTSIIITSCLKSDDNPPYYLDQWLGSYEGTSHHWTSYPVADGFYNSHTYKKIVVDVLKGEIDSTLNMTLTYNDTIVRYTNDLPISPEGGHFSQWGGGSSYGSLTVNFTADTLHYINFQKCGIPCSSGIDFSIARIKH